jgi:3-oxoacyl-[acyl-carrier protein] reductase
MRECVVFGASGGLGVNLTSYLQPLWFEKVLKPTSKEVNIAFESSVESFFIENQPDCVINLAVHNVDAMLHKTSRYDVERQVTVNALGMTAILRHCLPYMRERKHGRVIFISSILAKRPTPGTGIYSACKSFNETLIKVAARENKKYGITCNVLRLGYFDSGLIHDVPRDVRDGIEAQVTRLGKDEDLAQAIEFLIFSEYVTGAVIDVNGGL